MKAIILAAGRGSRMGSLTINRPKCMTQIQGKPMITWQIEAIKAAGIVEIAIVRGYMAESFQFDVQYFENERWNLTNMVMSLVAADQWLESDHCIVSYSDIIYPASAIFQLMNGSGDIVISYDCHWLDLWSKRFNDPLSDAETFRIDNNGILIDIGRRPVSIAEIEGQYMGLLKFSPKGWKQTQKILQGLPPQQQDKLDMTALLQVMIKNGESINTIPYETWWFEIDNAHDLKICESMLKEGEIILNGQGPQRKV